MSLTPSKVSPQKKNEEIVLSASVAGFYLPQYEFKLKHFYKIRFGFSFTIYIESSADMEIVQPSSENSSWSWFPDKAGLYIITVNVVDEKEKAETRLIFTVDESKEKKAWVSLTPSKASPQKIKKEIVFKALATGFSLPQYEFKLSRFYKIRLGFPFTVYIENITDMEITQSKSENSSWTWLPDKAGLYIITVNVMDEKEKAEAKLVFSIEGSNVK